MPARRPRTPDSTNHLFMALQPIVSGIQQTFGPTCEVVLHDYRHPSRSAMAVAGDVTGRTVGSPASEIGLRMIKLGDEALDELNYPARLPDGRQIKSTRSTNHRATHCPWLDLTHNRRRPRVRRRTQPPRPPVTFAEQYVEVAGGGPAGIRVSLSLARRPIGDRTDVASVTRPEHDSAPSTLTRISI